MAFACALGLAEREVSKPAKSEWQPVVGKRGRKGAVMCSVLLWGVFHRSVTVLLCWSASRTTIKALQRTLKRKHVQQEGFLGYQAALGSYPSCPPLQPGPPGFVIKLSDSRNCKHLSLITNHGFQICMLLKQAATE
eukprot:3775751-Amphidinium_carterae.1